MSEGYTHPFTVRWSDLDSNGHMANTAYMDYAIQSRFLYFKERGFTYEEFHRLGFGPVIFRDEISYHKELRLLEDFTVTLAVAELNEDGSRYTLHNTLRCCEGKLVARIVTTGAWLDLKTRKLIAPPVRLMEVLRDLLITEAVSES